MQRDDWAQQILLHVHFPELAKRAIYVGCLDSWSFFFLVVYNSSPSLLPSPPSNLISWQCFSFYPHYVELLT